MLSRCYKDSVSRLLHPAAPVLRKLGINPNHLTLAGFLFSAVAAAAYARGSMRMGGAILLLSGISDILDGSLARNTDTESRFGAFIDSVADRYGEFFIFFGLLWRLHLEGDSLHIAVLLAALMGSVMVSYTRARAESAVGECGVGLMERPERLIILIAFSLAGAVKPALWILAAGANVTAVHRILHTWRMAGRDR